MLVNIVGYRTCFADVENLYKIMRPLAYALSLVQSRSATLADCYSILSYLQRVASAFVVNADMRPFGSFASKVVKNRLSTLSCFYLHPKYRGADLITDSRATAFRIIAEYSNLIGSNASKTKSVISAGSHSLMYTKGEQSVDVLFDLEWLLSFFDHFEDTPTTWWSMIKDKTHGDCLQNIALRLLSITPHSVILERLCSILDCQHSKRRKRLSSFTSESIAKIQTY